VLLMLAACTAALVLALHARFEARSSPTPGPAPAPADFRLLGFVAILGGLSVPLVAASVRLPALGDLAVANPHAEMTVPALDAVSGDSIPIFEKGALVVSAARTHPLPLKIARLELDLGDGVGLRAVLPVGGGERLRLDHRAHLVWEICNVQPVRAASPGDPIPCTMLARFVRGVAGASREPRVSDVRGEVSAPPGFLVTAVVALVGASVLLFVSERRRRTVLRVVRGQQGMLHSTGEVESLGEHYALRVPPKHKWPGPVVLLDVDESADPYRGARSAGSVVPGTVEQHLGWYAQQRAMLHVVIGVPYLLAFAHLAAAGFVGYWGF
jgi:hypothetical protein